MSDNFGIEVRKTLLEKGLTLTYLAEKLGVSLPYVSDILKGNRKPEEKIQQIKQILKME